MYTANGWTVSIEEVLNKEIYSEKDEYLEIYF